MISCMKKIFLACLIGFLFIFTINTKAESTTTDTNTTTNGKLISAGITPDSPFYGIDRFFEKVSYILTFSDEKRIEKLTRFSEERLAEINTLDEDKDQEWLDDLYDDYGSNLNKANNILNKLIVKGKTKDTKIQKMQDLLEKASRKEELVKKSKKAKMNDELKNRVKEIKVQVYLTVLSDKITDADRKQLKNYGYGVIVKLNALCELTGLPMKDILSLDIYGPDDPTTAKIEKNIDFNKLQKVLNLDKEDLIEKLKEYHENKQKEQEAEEEYQHKQEEERKKEEEEAKHRQEEIQNDMNERFSNQDDEEDDD